VTTNFMTPAFKPLDYFKWAPGGCPGAFRERLGVRLLARVTAEAGVAVPRS
jgi:hypothetical protein